MQGFGVLRPEWGLGFGGYRALAVQEGLRVFMCCNLDEQLRAVGRDVKKIWLTRTEAFILYYTKLYYTTLYYTIPHFTALYSTIPYVTIPYYTTCTILNVTCYILEIAM